MSATPLPRYRSVSLAAVLSIVFGVPSVLTFFHWSFWLVPAIGVVLGWTALGRIHRAPEDLTGSILARVGIGLCVVLGLVGAGGSRLVEARQIPPGYRAVSFDDLQPLPGQLVPKIAHELEGKKIFITGFMYPGRRSTRIRQFVLVPSRSHCGFCSRQLKSSEMIDVRLSGDLTADFKTSTSRVGGIFRLDEAQVGSPYGALPYRIEADVFR